MGNSREKVEDLQSLLEISRAMTAEQDLDRLLELIMDRTTDLLNAERSTLFLYDDARKELFSRIAQKSEVKEIRVPLGEGIAGSVAENRSVVNIQDAYEDDRFNPEVDRETGFRTRSILCAPLINQTEDLIGVIQVLNKKDGVFRSYDEDLLSGLAANAAVALENARLFQHYREKQKIEQALKIARQIQQNLLPDTAPEIKGYSLEGFSRPADETGGDYYDFFEFPDGRIGFLIVDVTGHGIGPAILTATIRSTFHALVRNCSDPAEMLTTANNMLYDDMGDERFATGCLFVLDPEQAEVTYASAGHDSPLYLRSPEVDESRMLDSTGLPLGIVKESEYGKNGPLSLDPEGLIVLYTDGFTEAMDEEGNEFGEEKLVSHFLNHPEHSPSRLVQSLVREVEEHRGGAPQKDDLTMVVLKRHSTK